MRAVGVILAGGNSRRMKELSRKRAVCAMPVAGSYRSIDFALSNMEHSRIQKVAVLTQYNSRSLNEHLASSKWWDFGRKQGGMFLFTPSFADANSQWYRGTADAIAQNIGFLKTSHEPYVVIASGDCVRRHVVLKTEHLIGLAVVDDICDQVQVHTADGLCHYAFSFTCAEAGKVAVDNVGRTLVADIGQRILVLALALISPACKVKVDLRSHFLASFDRNYSKGTCGHCIQMSLIMQFDRFHEFVFLAFWLKVFYELNTVCEDGCVQLVDTAALLCLRLRTRMSLPVSLYSS